MRELEETANRKESRKWPTVGNIMKGGIRTWRRRAVREMDGKTDANRRRDRNSETKRGAKSRDVMLRRKRPAWMDGALVLLPHLCAWSPNAKLKE